MERKAITTGVEIGIDHATPYRVPPIAIEWILAGIVFLCGVGMSGDTFLNHRLVWRYEFLFMAVYLAALDPDGSATRWVRHHKTITFLALVALVATALFRLYLHPETVALLLAAGYLVLFLRQHFLPALHHHRTGILLLLAWAVSVTLSYLVAQERFSGSFLAQERYLQTLTHAFVFILAWHFFGHRPPAVKTSFMALALSVFAEGAGFLYVYLSERPDNVANWLMHPPFHAHMRHVGYQLTAALAALLPLAMPANGNRVRVITALMTALWTFLFWSGGRAPVGAVTLTAIVVASLYAWFGMRVRRYLLLLFVTALAGAVAAQMLHVSHWSGVLSSLARSVEAKNLDQFTSGRLEIWAHSLRTIGEHWLLGYGPHGFFLTKLPRMPVDQPHNLLLQFLLEWGASGTLLFLAATLTALWAGWNPGSWSRRDLPATLVPFSVIVALTLHGGLDGTYFHPQPSFYLALAFAAWSSGKSSAEPSSLAARGKGSGNLPLQ